MLACASHGILVRWFAPLLLNNQVSQCSCFLSYQYYIFNIHLHLNEAHGTVSSIPVPWVWSGPVPRTVSLVERTCVLSKLRLIASKEKQYQLNLPLYPYQQVLVESIPNHSGPSCNYSFVLCDGVPECNHYNNFNSTNP